MGFGAKFWRLDYLVHYFKFGLTFLTKGGINLRGGWLRRRFGQEEFGPGYLEGGLWFEGRPLRGFSEGNWFQAGFQGSRELLFLWRNSL